MATIILNGEQIMTNLVNIQTQNNQIAVTEVSLSLPENLSISEYVETGTKVHSLHKATSWLLADLLTYGEDHYGDQFSQIVDEWGYKPETLRNCLYVAKKWPRNRRRSELSFAHHQSISAVEPEVADKMLQAAIDRELSVAELRVLKREYLRELSGEEEKEPEEPKCPNCGYIL